MQTIGKIERKAGWRHCIPLTLFMLTLLLAMNVSAGLPLYAGNKPLASGVMFDPADPAAVSGITMHNTTVTVVKENGAAALKMESAATSGYPDIDFPVPTGGWDLSDYGGVQVDVANTGQTDALVGLRLDNAGEWATKPFNTELVKLAPGASKTITVAFGVSYHSAGFALDSAHVIRVKLFLISPKPPTTLNVANLKAIPKSAVKALPIAAPIDPNKLSLPGTSKPADRNISVTPPAWVGKRPPVAGDWVQTFNDNFDGTTLDAKNWTPWWNGLIPNQLQSYTKDDDVLTGGVLHIITEKRAVHMRDEPTFPIRAYASGYIHTYDKFEQLYGYFEARMKLPTARGLWPAFWMMPDRGANAGSEGQRASTYAPGMEIDIMEQLAEWGPGRYNIATHWDGYGADHKHWGNSSTYYGPTSDDWHTWGALWEPGKITWFCDGIKKAEWENERVGSLPMYMILNVQIGGWATQNVDDSKLPDPLQVDYVRAWQLKSRITQ